MDTFFQKLLFSENSINSFIFYIQLGIHKKSIYEKRSFSRLYTFDSFENAKNST